jgi:predicted ATPase/class 3 adenylate cyclase
VRWSDVVVSELLPTGTVTLLLADVEGSTRLWGTQPDRMTAAFERLDRTLADLVRAHDGVRPVEQGEGDSFVLAFRRASDAVACALDLQRSELSPIRLRIGVHTGEVQLRDEGNYIGSTINKTARIRDLGHGGQTLLSGATEEMVIDLLPLDAWLKDLGTHRLRGVARPERIVQLCQADIRNEFAPIRTTDSIPSYSIPVSLTSFVGRGDQIKEVRQLLAANRLVTLTGAGGAGKTRLSMQVAEQLSAEFRDGACYVDLAPITDPDAVPAAVSRALGLPTQPGRSTVDALTRFIADRHMLAVLDNCEHLLDASARLVVTLLGACPGLTLLGTSREPVGVPGEVTWRIPSLSLTDEAIELFTDRARRVRPDFVADGKNIATVTEICRQLDGMPLAIELAAARVRALSLSEILDGLRDRFRLLTGGGRTAVRRQQTLRASVDWSHDLLAESERTLFRRLGVFVGGFDLDAAQAVVAPGEQPRYDVLDQLSLLVDKSLVVAEDTGGHTRYRLLETMRQYALDKLNEAGEAHTVRTRYVDYYMALLDVLGRRERTSYAQVLWRGITEFDNLRAAFAQSAQFDPDPDLLTRAARGAAWLLDLPLADRLADTAIRAGAGVDANIVRAHVLSFLNRGEEADRVLAAALDTEVSDIERARIAFARSLNRLFTLQDPAGAKNLIDEAANTTPPQARPLIDAFLTVYWAAMGKPDIVKQIAENLDWEKLPDAGAARATAWGITVALGDAGAASDAVAAAESGYPIPVRGYFVLTDAHLGALLLAGRLTEALDIAELGDRPAGNSPSRQFDPIFGTIMGRAAIASGHLGADFSLVANARDKSVALGSTHGWVYRAQLLHTTALAMSGMTDEALVALADLERGRHPGWRYLDYEYGIAEGWVAASRGAVTDAIAATLSAAETARANGQFAAEVMCLQTAAQFGDGTVAARLHELAQLVEGPRAPLAARLAAALRADDSTELAAVSTDFEEMGDMLAALDAASHAAMTYRRQGSDESASEYLRRAEALVEKCGASTPASTAALNR